MEGKPKQRNYSRELKNAMVNGSTVECAVAPYEGVTVAFRPRCVNDARPWVTVPDNGYRYSGRYCRVRVDES